MIYFFIFLNTLSFRLPSGRDEIVQVKIPAGVQNGVTFRYSGMGDDADNTVPRGNLLIKVNDSFLLKMVSRVKFIIFTFLFDVK